LITIQQGLRPADRSVASTGRNVYHLTAQESSLYYFTAQRK
jgi:hypothetical protein